MSSDEATAECARAALDAYVRIQGSAGERQFEIIDLVTDLLHLAASEGLDPRAINANAALHLQAETGQIWPAPFPPCDGSFGDLTCHG
jgi:hypothetical protein